MERASVFVGTAGFSYTDWLGNFYPQFCPAADFLRCYAMRFRAVELDSTFYRIPKEETVLKWAKMTPDEFRFSAKFPRTVTHEGDLESRRREAAAFVRAISGLGEKLGPLLLQFPGSFRPDRAEVLNALLDEVPTKYRVAVEFRCSEWLTEEVYSDLRKRRVGLCLAAFPGMPKVPVRTADHVYLRLVGDHRGITEDFSYVRDDKLDELQWWEDLAAEFAGENAEIYAYFNNHYTGHAPSTAMDFKERLESRINRVS
jgi:uncharacterized protein YecE (DUF72 family)